MTITAIRHTGIVVSDMQASLHFYRDLLGLEVWADFTDNSDYVQAVTGVPGADVWMIKLKARDGGPTLVHPHGDASVLHRQTRAVIM